MGGKFLCGYLLCSGKAQQDWSTVFLHISFGNGIYWSITVVDNDFTFNKTFGSWGGIVLLGRRGKTGLGQIEGYRKAKTFGLQWSVI